MQLPLPGKEKENCKENYKSPLLFARKLRSCSSAGLLARSVPTAFPSAGPRKNLDRQWHLGCQNLYGTHSYGDSSGFSPDSLFILCPGKTKDTDKPSQYYTKDPSFGNGVINNITCGSFFSSRHGGVPGIVENFSCLLLIFSDRIFLSLLLENDRNYSYFRANPKPKTF